jgi:hypothetical protein
MMRWNMQRDPGVMYIQTKGHGKSQLEAAVYKLRKETSSKPNCIAILILDFQLLELCENKLLFYKPSICGFFFMAVLANKYRQHPWHLLTRLQ